MEEITMAQETQLQNTSILTSIKKMLGIQEEETAFDTDITIHINSVLASLVQMGIGPEEGYSINGASEQWGDFLQNDKRLESVKSYVYLKVRIIFDPPASSTILEAYKQQISEFEWRNYIVKDDDRIRGEQQ